MGLAPLQGENVGGGTDRQIGILRVEEELDLLFSEALDIHGVAGNEVTQPFDGLRRTDEPAGAAANGLPLLPDRMAVAGRAAVGKDVGQRLMGPLLEHRVEVLGDDGAGPLDADGIVYADVPPPASGLPVIAYALDVGLIVLRRVDHYHPADRDRFQTGVGRP